MNTEEKQAFYQAFRSKDARFDGRFFIGVKSTGIYCRPVCRARLPKPENCEYFRTASEAEQAGYRPCLLCRPELAPGSSPIDASSQLAWRAAGLLRENCGSGINLPALAGELGCTDRHLRRVFRQTCHVTPVQYLQTCRLLLAKELLTDTSLPVLDIAMAAGFGSVRRMNELFQQQYHMTPTRLRRESAAKASDGALAVSIGYRPPYNWPAMLTFLRQRAIPGIERVENDGYERTVGIRSRTGELCKGWLRVENVPGRNMLRAVFSESLVPVLPQVLACVRHLFDTDCDPALIGETLEDMNTLRPDLYTAGTRLPGSFDVFETAVRAILGQQITVRAAGTLAGRIAGQYGQPVSTGREGLCRLFPSPADIAGMGEAVQDNLGRLGIIRTRSACIAALARAMLDGNIHLGRFADPETEIGHLLAVRGIGKWTAGYIAMRTMGWPDAFLETDAGIRHALPDYTDKERAALAMRWRPWRSYAVINLWNHAGKENI